MLVYVLNSFSKDASGGNPAGVVIGQSKLTLQQMQRTAKEAGFSETVFIQASSKADYRARFFTPNSEVDLCGHATIAAFNLLHRLKLINPGQYTMETMAGILKVEVDHNSRVFMNQGLPEFYEKIQKEVIQDCFDNEADFIDENTPIQIVSTGLKDIIVPVKNLELLLSLKPKMEKIIEVSRKYNVIGLHVYSRQTFNNSTAHCRNFAPLYEIPEESATGTSNGALACYLWKYNALEADKIHNIIFEQGYCMNRPSEIIAKLEINHNKIAAVKIGGNALLAGQINTSC